MTESSSSEVFQLTCADLTHSSLIWMARSSTAPMQSSNTGIKSARKSAWILKSSLPPLTEDAQSTCWRSWSLNSPTGSVRKSLLSFVPLHPMHHPSESPKLRSLVIIIYSWILVARANGLGTISQMLTLKSTNQHEGTTPVGQFIHHGTDMLSQGTCIQEELEQSGVIGLSTRALYMSLDGSAQVPPTSRSLLSLPITAFCMSQDLRPKYETSSRNTSNQRVHHVGKAGQTSKTTQSTFALLYTPTHPSRHD